MKRKLLGYSIVVGVGAVRENHTILLEDIAYSTRDFAPRFIRLGYGNPSSVYTGKSPAARCPSAYTQRSDSVCVRGSYV